MLPQWTKHEKWSSIIQGCSFISVRRNLFSKMLLAFYTCVFAIYCLNRGWTIIVWQCFIILFMLILDKFRSTPSYSNKRPRNARLSITWFINWNSQSNNVCMFMLMNRASYLLADQTQMRSRKCVTVLCYPTAKDVAHDLNDLMMTPYKSCSSQLAYYSKQKCGHETMQ